MNFFRATITVSVFVILGRITGFLREIAIAHSSGVSQNSDVLIIILTFPDMMINLLLGGGLAAALTPSFTKMIQSDSYALLLRASLVIGIIFTLLTILISLNAKAILSVLAVGWDAETIQVTIPYFRISAMALPLMALSGVFVAFLNSRGQFATASMGTLVFNTVVITALISYKSVSTPLALGLGVLAGSKLRLIIQILASLKHWVKPNFSSRPEYLILIHRFLGAFSFFTLLALLPPVSRTFASLGEKGSISEFNFAQKIVELPMIVIVSAIATVLLPRLSKTFQAGRIRESERILGLAIRAALVILLCVSSSTFFMSETLTKIIFFSSPMTDAQFNTLGTLVSLGMVGLPFQGLVVLYGTAFVSYERTNELFVTSTIMILVMVCLTLCLQSSFGVAGVMFSYISAYAVGACVLTVKLVLFLGWQPLVFAFDKPSKTILLPLITSISISFFSRYVLGEQWSILLISSIAFLLVFIVSDVHAQRLLRAAKNFNRN